MTENMNYDTGASWCYDKKSSNCKVYGRLYNWETAMAVCPTGWHLPTVDEWRKVVVNAGGASAAGKKLKATRGWEPYLDNSGNGTDNKKFAALPGGCFGCSYSSGFSGLGTRGIWWTSDANANYSWASTVVMNNSSDYVNGTSGGGNGETESVGHGVSVRCVAD